MKHLSSLLLLLGLTTALRAAEPIPGIGPDGSIAPALPMVEPTPEVSGPLNIHVDLLVISVPDAKALELLPQLRDAAQVGKAYAALQTLLKNKQAHLVAWPTLVTRSGVRSVVEMNQEIRYPSEFGEGHKPSKPAEVAPVPAMVPLVPEKPPGPDAAKPAKPLQIVPTAFETRNLGVTLEFEPSLSPDGQNIDANFAAQYTFAGTDKITVTDAQRTITIEQPRIGTHRVATNITFVNGRPLLIGIFRSFDKPEWTEFFIIQAATKPARK